MTIEKTAQIASPWGVGVLVGQNLSLSLSIITETWRDWEGREIAILSSRKSSILVCNKSENKYYFKQLFDAQNYIKILKYLNDRNSKD